MRKRYFHRRNLPHLHCNEGEYFITFRLKDSLPSSEVQKLKEDLENSTEELSIKEKRLFKRYNELLDSKRFGYMTITEEAITNIIKEILHKYDGLYYELICYCIMPNHVHLVFTILDCGKSLSDIMKRLKGSSAIAINKHLKREGSLWQAESFDRLVREEKELYNIIKYVLLNPVNANLVSDWKEWKHTYCHPSYLVLD